MPHSSFVHSSCADCQAQTSQQVPHISIVHTHEWQSPEQATGMGCISGLGVWCFFLLPGVMYGRMCGGSAGAEVESYELQSLSLLIYIFLNSRAFY